MRATRSRLGFASAVVVVLALLALLGLEVHSSQQRAHRLVEQRFRGRAVETASLTASVFASATRSAGPMEARRFGRRRVGAVDLAPRPGEQLTYRVLLDSSGHVLAASPGTPASATAALAALPPHVHAVLAGHPFAISGMGLSAARQPQLEYAQALTTRFGRRVIVVAFPTRALAGFIAGYLTAAGAPRASAYVLDSHGALVASASPRDRVGSQLADEALLGALSRENQGSIPGGRYFVAAAVPDSSWRVVLVAPRKTLFATTDANAYVPWVLLGGLTLAGLFALILLWRVIQGQARMRLNNERLELANEELRSGEERFRLLVDGVPDYAIFMLDGEGRVASWNTGAGRIHGYAEDQILGTHFSVFFPPEEIVSGKVAGELLVAKRDGRYEEEGWRVRADGSRFWATAVLTALRNPDGSLRGYAKVIRDITDRRIAEEKLLHDAMHDGLTGLPNRALFLDRLTQALARARRSDGHGCAVLFLDVDRFKLINDTYSHQVGDELLIELARRLDSSLRPGDTVARLGGDEFTVLLDDLADDEGAAEIATRILSLLDEQFRLSGRDVRISASIGISHSDAHMTAADMMRNADIAMYAAKREGRSRVAIFNESMYSDVAGRLELENDLRDAIEERSLAVHYQPIIDLRDGSLRGLEALVRWPSNRNLAADEFVAVAEEVGLIEPLGRLVLDEACARLSEWRASGVIAPHVTISVNISGRQLVSGSLVADVVAALDRSGLPAELLQVELTESTIIKDPERMQATLAQLRDIGVEAHIDDFGTGYSSLTFLHHFPGDTLKVDRSFIASMHTNASHEAIVRGIVALAHSIDFEVIAEGVDDPVQLERLRRIGCEFAQGFLFSEPLCADAVAGFVRSWEPGLATIAA
jgi:diguanylate cyclase (GGDEF)-like protein/PAS domain S-box-containing protein